MGARGYLHRWERCIISLVSYHPPQAGQLPANKVLSHHSLPASLGACSSGIHPDKWAVNCAPSKTKAKTPALHLGCWNVRTMTLGQTDNLLAIEDTRKTAVINNELLKRQTDICTLQETRLLSSGPLRERDYTFFWQGRPPGETREYGVCFAVKNMLLGALIPPTGGSERILTLCLNTTRGSVHLVSVYAPTLSAPQEVKDKFYDELCSYHNLCITNSYFQSKPHHKVSWRHPWSGHWHQLDLIITRRSDLRNVLQTRSFHSADCDTDHSLVCCKIKLQVKNFHRARPKGPPRVDSSKAADPTKAAAFLSVLEESIPRLPQCCSAQQY
ncbi:hypothetical protein D4764_06G0008150 [Takifugu flavidus]|uniref:Endonuclease/exonuclease/phosphatase domain-containing protein n=1 Tax=Takifugu flavidus TaxID=433684 RepID=A0A5C6MWN1_9TELE|nr:hypothetical protein D4764_06G0008150 [Takifugu flavidus]